MLAVVAHQVDATNPGMARREFAHDIPTAVVALVVDEDQLAQFGAWREHFGEALGKQRQTAFRVVDRHDNRHQHPLIIASDSRSFRCSGIPEAR